MTHLSTVACVGGKGLGDPDRAVQPYTVKSEEQPFARESGAEMHGRYHIT